MKKSECGLARGPSTFLPNASRDFNQQNKSRNTQKPEIMGKRKQVKDGDVAMEGADPVEGESDDVCHSAHNQPELMR